MRRTFIVTIEGDAADHEGAESDLLDHCDNIANSYRCGCQVDICVEPLSDGLLSDLCNTGKPTIRDALERAWSHVNRSLEIAEGDEDPPEDIESMRSDLQVIEAAQGLLKGRTP